MTRTFRFITPSANPNFFDPHKPPHRTRDGHQVRIICTDRRGHPSFPILALILYGEGQETLASYPITGKSPNPSLDLLSTQFALNADEALQATLNGYESGLTWSPGWNHIPGGPYLTKSPSAQHLENHAQWMQGWADGIRAQDPNHPLISHPNFPRPK